MKNIKISKESIGKIILLIVFFSICYFIPYTHDDWAWGSEIGIERLTSLFADYNGRWASNILAIVLTRYHLLRAIIVFISIILLLKLAQNIINKNRKSLIYLIAILLLLMPHNIIAQTIAWTSGYVNYILPILFTTFYIYINKNIFTKSEIKISNKFIIPMLLFGFITSLMVENITIYNILLSLFIIIYSFVYSKKINLSNIFYFLGSLMGAIFMFSNGAYANIFGSTDGYRTIEQGNIIIRAVKTYFETICNYLIQNNIIINIFIGVMALIILYKFTKSNKDKIKKVTKIALTISSILIIGYISYEMFIYIANNANIFLEQKYKMYAEGVGNILFAIAIILIIILCVKDKNRKFRLLFEIFNILIIVAPLFIVTPIGPRNFFATYFMFAILAIDMFDYVIPKEKINLNNGLIGTTLILLSFYFIIYGQIFYIDTKRIDYIKDRKDDTIIYLPALPNPTYLQHGNPVNDVFMERYRLYYGIDKDTTLIFVEYKEWQKKYNK